MRPAKSRLKLFLGPTANQSIVRRNYDRSTATTEAIPRGSDRGFRARLLASSRPVAGRRAAGTTETDRRRSAYRACHRRLRSGRLLYRRQAVGRAVPISNCNMAARSGASAISATGKPSPTRPDVYMPQFGGYDPVGVARGVAVAGNPDIWLISGGRLFLFYDRDRLETFAADPTHHQRGRAQMAGRAAHAQPLDPLRNQPRAPPRSVPGRPRPRSRDAQLRGAIARAPGRLVAITLPPAAVRTRMTGRDVPVARRPEPWIMVGRAFGQAAEFDRGAAGDAARMRQRRRDKLCVAASRWERLTMTISSPAGRARVRIGCGGEILPAGKFQALGAAADDPAPDQPERRRDDHAEHRQRRPT